MGFFCGVFFLRLIFYLALQAHFTVKIMRVFFFPAIRANISLGRYDASSISLSEAGFLHFIEKKIVERTTE